MEKLYLQHQKCTRIFAAVRRYEKKVRNYAREKGPKQALVCVCTRARAYVDSLVKTSFHRCAPLQDELIYAFWCWAAVADGLVMDIALGNPCGGMTGG